MVEACPDGMPFCRFNLEDHRIISDPGMHECIDERHAQEVADDIAEHLAQAEPELLLGGHAIVVRDFRNKPVYRAEMDAMSISRRRS
jgi:hypothetical protein